MIRVIWIIISMVVFKIKMWIVEMIYQTIQFKLQALIENLTRKSLGYNNYVTTEDVMIFHNV
jgi:hypothetical protein